MNKNSKQEHIESESSISEPQKDIISAFLTQNENASQNKALNENVLSTMNMNNDIGLNLNKLELSVPNSHGVHGEGKLAFGKLRNGGNRKEQDEGNIVTIKKQHQNTPNVGATLKTNELSNNNALRHSMSDVQTQPISSPGYKLCFHTPHQKHNNNYDNNLNVQDNNQLNTMNVLRMPQQFNQMNQFNLMKKFDEFNEFNALIPKDLTEFNEFFGFIPQKEDSLNPKNLTERLEVQKQYESENNRMFGKMNDQIEGNLYFEDLKLEHKMNLQKNNNKQGLLDTQELENRMSEKKEQFRSSIEELNKEIDQDLKDVNALSQYLKDSQNSHSNLNSNKKESVQEHEPKNKFNTLSSRQHSQLTNKHQV